MINCIKKIAVFTLVAGITAGSLLAAPFEELFQIKNINGKCYVKTADAAKFVKAEQNKAYPYGTSIKTDKKGSATIVFSKNNTCMLKANTLVILSEEENKKNKIIKIDEGNIDVNLDKEFHKSNGLKVVTATGTCKAIGCIFSISQAEMKKKTAVTFDCQEGTIGVVGEDYEAPELGAKDVLAVTTSKDNGESRIEIVKGDIDLKIKNSQGQPEIKKTTEGSVVKIWRRATESGTDKSVTILITGKEGELKEVVTYIVPMPKAKVLLPKASDVAVPTTAAAVAQATDDKKDNPEKDSLAIEDPLMQHTDELLELPSMIGISTAKGNDQIHKELDAANPPPVVVVPKPKPKPPTPTPVGAT